MAINDYFEAPEENVLLAMLEDDIKDYNGNEFTVTGTYSFAEDAFVGKHIIIPKSSYLKIVIPGFAVGMGDFTIDYWTYTGENCTGDVSSTQVNLAGFRVEPYRGSFWIGQNATGRSLAYDETINTEWTHIALVRQGETQYGFVNGKLVGTKSGSGIFDIKSNTFVLNLHRADYTTNRGSSRLKAVRFCNFVRWLEDFTPPDPLNTTKIFPITEKYGTTSGVQIQGDTSINIVLGQDYSKAAPQFQGYSYEGYSLDNSPLKYANVAVINNVASSHLVKFLYRGNGSGVETCDVTEKYQDENGRQLSPAFIKTVVKNEDFISIAPTVSGYACIGYIINGGTLQTGDTASIANIANDHTVIFVYRVDCSSGKDNSPVATVVAMAAQTPPEGWLECDGRAVSRSQYADLFAAIGALYGSGDGINTFNLPDLRGEFIRGWDNGRGKDANRQFGSAQKGSLLTADQDQNDGCQVQNFSQNNLRDKANWDEPPADSSINLAWMNLSPYNDSTVINGTNPVLGVARPYNVSMMYCIKI